jgi:hypothetical protein
VTICVPSANRVRIVTIQARIAPAADELKIPYPMSRDSGCTSSTCTPSTPGTALGRRQFDTTTNPCAPNASSNARSDSSAPAGKSSTRVGVSTTSAASVCEASTSSGAIP